MACNWTSTGCAPVHAGICAREAAYSVAAILGGASAADTEWLLRHHDDNQRTRIRQHIRFADFWYSANGNFTDLQEYTREIARDAGIDLDPSQPTLDLKTPSEGRFIHSNRELAAGPAGS